MSFDRAPAYTKAFPYLSAVHLPEGAINLVRNVPSRDITLLAPTANVVVNLSSVAVLWFGLLGAVFLSLAGVLTSIWAEKFDHIAAVTNFVVTPAAFLSGTFYTIDRLPDPWHLVALWDPFFYMIDGFRYGFIGFADGSLLAGAIMVAVINLILAIACWALFQTGYRLKS